MRRAWVEIDLGALFRNATTIAERAGVPLLPMIKADAYGLGAVRVAMTLEPLNPRAYGVATVSEGEELRRAGIDREIIVFTPVFPNDLDAVQRDRLTPALSTRAEILLWSPTRLPWHLAIDTGMNRAGAPWNDVSSLRDLVAAHPPEGAFTHFYNAYKQDNTWQEQESRFEKALESLGVRPELLHTENSAGVERAGASRWDAVRPGVFLYGVQSRPDAPVAPEPVVSVRARVVELRTIADGDSVSYGATWVAKGRRRIATLPIGYADGYRRALSNRASVLVRGVPAPIAGVVTMDMTMIDVTDVPCEIGDVATLIGADGRNSLTVADVAAMGDLSPYELLTGLRTRLPRRYVGLTGDGDR